MTTASEAMVAATARLRAAGVPDPARDARLLLAHAARVDAARVTLIAPDDIAPDIEERYEQLIALRAIRVPVSQLIGERAFYGRAFKITSDVLDPRPETETLIEAALGRPFQRVLDLGVGSGAIIVTLLAECEEATGLGVDLSQAACLQTAANAVYHKVDGRLEVLESDWFARVDGRFDLIVSNPPYLAREEMADVAPELAQHEPRLALTDEGDGLSAYRVIAREAAGYLLEEGRILVEIGWTQAEAVQEIFEEAGWADIAVLCDLDGRPRVVMAQSPA